MDWQNNLKREMGGRIKRARVLADLTQTEMANDMGVSRQAVALWESGENAVSSPHLARLAQLLRVSTDWLCGTAPLSENDPPDELEDLLASALSLVRRQRRSNRHNGGDAHDGYSNHQNRRALAVMVG